MVENRKLKIAPPPEKVGKPNFFNCLLDINFKIYHNYDMIHHFICRKFGFTLAEVLITLGIIGIVAAITLPSVINKTQDKQFKSMFKKQYSAIAQALQMVYAKDGENLDFYSGTGINNQNFWKMAIFICKIGAELKTVKSSLICTEENMNMGGNMQYNNDVSWHKSNNWFDKQGNPMVLNSGYNKFNLILSDGALINFNCRNYVFIDVNGYNKPNTVGRDIFYFKLNEKNLTPIFFDNDNVNACTSPYNTQITEDNYKEDCETGSGWGCSPLYIME